MAEMNRWEIWEADVPFEENNGHKKRPMLILSEYEAVVLSLKMTSHEARYKNRYTNCNFYSFYTALTTPASE